MRITIRHTITASLVALAAATVTAAAPALALDKPDRPAASADCALSHSVNWGDDAASGLVATASTQCEGDGRIWATLRVSDAAGEIRFEARYPTDEVMLLAWPGETGLAGALEDWLTAFTDLDNTIHLPREDAEFPFYPAEGLTDADIDALRTMGHDMACYVQGMESAMCLVRDGDGVREIGVQLFPG